ncbi:MULTISPECIES: hypothetical protein [Clostridium]|uniref:Uncharacterized protein n=1 Tax=Clostridium frigoriphilum TaxID=443253 RepID=A0ABU7UUH3_9CLOT|nr:hypothetical protein [Clostridium sp. DSM 17811]MBU3098741.1 hypothetical protein [Clostridium sp. DSM 17811]
MIYNYTMGIYGRTSTVDEYGETVESAAPTWIKDIDVDKQPYSSAQAKKDYGFDVICTDRIYTDLETDIKINTVIKYGLLTYKVQKIISWLTWMELVVLLIE